MKNSVFIFFLLCAFSSARITAQTAGPRRPEEDARRRADIEKQLAELRLRSRRTIDESVRRELNRALREVSSPANRGITDVFPGIFRVSDVRRVLSNEGLEGEGVSLEGLKFFQRQLAERGIDLIVMPVGNQVLLHGYKLVPGEIHPGDDLWPAYTRILIDLLQEGIEVIDVRTAFEEHLAQHPDDDPLNHFDHHWSSTGMGIGARLVAERLQRYAFIREAAPGKRRFSVEQVTAPADISFLNLNEVQSERVPSLNIPKAVPAVQILYDGAPLNVEEPMLDRIDPLLIMGDSMARHRRGSSFAEHLSKEVGFPLPHRAENGGANFAPRRYAERWIREPGQPRVIVLTMALDQVLRDWPVIRLPDPRGDRVAASAKFIATDETTLGNWKGKYGGDGYFIVGEEPKLPPALLLHGSPQVLPTINVPGSLVFRDEDSDMHADQVNLRLSGERANTDIGLLKASGDSGDRSTSTWRNHITRVFGVDVHFQDDNEHRVALYVADLPGIWKWTTIEVQNADASNRKTLEPARRIEFGDKGVYVIYQVRGRVRFLVRDGSPALAGLFFDTVPGTAQTRPAAPPGPGAGEPLIVDGRVDFVSGIPDPKTSPYADALTTVIFQTARPLPGTGQNRAYVIGWAFRDRELVEISRFRAGENWRLELVEWDRALRENPRLETIQRIDQTEFDPDLPVFWVPRGQPVR